MAQKYKCNRCGSIFSADGQGDVRCPQCGSEDIVVVNDGGSSKKIIIAVLIFIILAASGLVAYKLISDSDKSGEEISPLPSPSYVEFEQMDVNMLPTINSDSTAYNFSVYAVLSENITEQINYTIKLDNGKTITSTDGSFANVPSSKSADYVVTAFVKGRPDINESSITVNGFLPIVKRENIIVEGTDNPETVDDEVTPRVTIEQVQQWVNNLLTEGSGSMLVKTRGNNLVQQPVHWAFTNLKAGESKPQNASVVMEKLDTEWESLTVVSITTSPANGMLTSLACKINYRE